MSTVSPPTGRAVRAAGALASVALAAFAAEALFGARGGGLDAFFNYWVYYGLLLVAIGAVAVRVVVAPGERWAWFFLGAAIAIWTAGDMLSSFAYGSDPPFPSAADALYIGFYPLCYVAIGLLARQRLAGLAQSLWLDGVMAALAVSTVASAVLLQVVLDHTAGGLSTVAVNLAYPLGDGLLLALVVGVTALSGWRFDLTWAALGIGLVAAAIADSIYLVQAATSTYVEGTILDVLWPAAMLLLARAAWASRRPRTFARIEGRPLVATPLVCGLIALAVFVADHFHRLNPLAGVMAGLTLAAVVARGLLTLREHGRLLVHVREQAVVDPLTGLGNRRQLMTDLEEAVAAATPMRQCVFAMFDLDGFKHYNDTFGHPAGDALLARLGRRLGAASAGAGTAYRLGGDEFCVLAAIDAEDLDEYLRGAVDALTENGDGFAIRTSFGTALVPADANAVSDVLRIADQRLYARKHSTALGRGQPHEALLQALFEREPHLHEHVRLVADLSADVGERLELDDRSQREVVLAAELHDVGKLAVPDDVLRKTGPLTPDEWEFIRQHTVIGQRILSASPPLSRVGLIVRSTHEHVDGSGYPDGLAGPEIPLASRIVSACDAYAAMTSERPYQGAFSPARALVELRRCAGTQFDPDVVAALAEVVMCARRAPRRLDDAASVA